MSQRSLCCGYEGYKQGILHYSLDTVKVCKHASMVLHQLCFVIARSINSNFGGAIHMHVYALCTLNKSNANNRSIDQPTWHCTARAYLKHKARHKYFYALR